MAPCAVKNDDESEAETNSNVDNGHDSDTEAREDPHYASSSSPTLKRTSTTPHLSTTSPAAASPKLPREGSPVRPQFNAIASTGSRVTSRSRKNSQDLSPIRAPSASIPTVPSAAAIQRALSATRTPHLPAPQSPEFASEAPRSQRTNKGPTLSSQHQALNIVRVESPPSSASPAPKNSVLSAAQKIDQSLSNPKTPTIIVERPDRSSALAVDLDVADENHSTISGTRTPARGMSGNALPLETVQEGSAPATPATGINRSAQTVKGASNDRPDRIDENPMEEAFEKEAKPKAESGNESAGSKRGGTKGADDTTEKRKTATIVNSVQPPMIQSKRSLTQLPFTRTKTATDGSVKNMTVETETVSSIPQVALGGGAGERNILGRTDTGGTLRIKPSTETIRPKKEKKKVARKAPSLNSGTGRTASSKADIFEAKVASAVGEANSSDSEETFVYESNPPEPHSAHSRRFHSRTPSTTSTASQMDHHGAKGRQDVHHHSIIGKKSMKFANNYNSIGYSNDGSEGTMRGPSLSGRPTSGNTSQHHHIGRYGRGGHASLFDNDSLFPIATKSTRSAASQLHNLSTRHASSRNPQVVHVAKSSRKLEEILSYDLEGEGADDERTPLVGSVRVGRNRRRPLPGSVRQMYSENRGHNCCGRITAFIALGSSLALLIAAMVVIVVMCSKQLVDVHAKDIRNLLVSEQEIMLDLHVHAINPNLIAIQISDLDVNIFARSKHVGMSALRPSDHPRIMTEGIHSTAQTIEATSQDLPPLIETPSDVIPHFDGGVDEGTDPIDDPTTDSPKMLLGQIYEFDSPLVFDPSPISHRSFGSVGEVRLAKPGNKTEDGGTDRWEHVLQYDFELIIRGVLKYSLPISSKVQKAKISASTIVHAGEAIDNAGNVRITEPMRPLEPGGNVSVKGAGQGVRLRMKARS